MVQNYFWIAILLAVIVAGYGFSLHRRNYPSGLLMVMVGLLVVFFSLGFVAQGFV